MKMLIFIKKELMGYLRTSRLLAMTAVFLFFGLLSPATARYMNEIIAAVGDFEIQLPDPVYLDAYAQFIKNMNSICIIVLILVISSTITAEKTSGSILLVLTKGITRTQFYLSKLITAIIAFTIVFVIGLAGCILYTQILFNEFANIYLIQSMLLLWVFGVFFTIMAVFISTISKSTTLSSVLCFAGYIILSTASAFDVTAKFTPVTLASWPLEIMAAVRPMSDVYLPLIITIVLGAMLCLAGIQILNKQEL